MPSLDSRKSALLAIALLVCQSSLPAFAFDSDWQDGSSASLGQSEWVSPSGSAPSSSQTNLLGQSDWVGSQGSAANSGAGVIGQSQWIGSGSSTRSQASGAVSQSGWSQPSSAKSVGQSGWVSSGNSAASYGSSSNGQSGWTTPGTADGYAGQSSFMNQQGSAGAMNMGQSGQSDWTSSNGQSMMTNNATMVPRAMAQSSNPQLQGSVSSTNQFGGADMNSLGSGDMSADMGTGSHLKNFKDIDETCPSPASGGMGMMGMGMGMGGSMAGAMGGGMEEMIGNVMMMPMMMAASSGLMGQGFRTFGSGGGGGGFRTYGPGGGVGGQRTVSLSKRGANDAGYFARRAAVRALRRVGR